MDELEKCHRKQQADMQTEIKKEMALLQKKMLMESVRKQGGRGEKEKWRGFLIITILTYFSNIKRYLTFDAPSRTC